MLINSRALGLGISFSIIHPPKPFSNPQESYYLESRSLFTQSRPRRIST